MTPSPNQTYPFVFEGRHSQFDLILSRLRVALAGRPQIVFVCGEAGVGKTAFVRELCNRALEADDRPAVAWAQCSSPAGLGDPYLPFREILTSLMASSGDAQRGGTGRLGQAAGHGGSALAEIGPDLVGFFFPGAGLIARAASFLAKRAGWLEPLERLTRTTHSELKAEQIFEQFSRVILRAAEHSPLVLVLDDLHWADAGSLELLFYLSRRLAEERRVPLLIIGTYRPSEVTLGRSGEPHPLARVVGEVCRYLGDVKIDLGATVGGPPGRAFIDAILDAEPNALDEGFRGVLFKRTEGHPLFTVEVLRALRERGVLSTDSQGRWFAARPLDPEDLPDRVEAVIGERLRRLPPELRGAVDCGSVEGERFTAEVIAKVCEQPPLRVSEWLDSELQARHGLVAAAGDRHLSQGPLNLYRFQHALFREYLYRSLGQMRRRQLHLAIGNALEEMYGDQADEIAGELAGHFDLAGAAGKAGRYYRLAADRARHLFLNEDAAQMYGRALDLLGDEGEAALRFELLAGRESVYNLLGRRDAQKADLDEMLSLAAREGDFKRLATAHNRMANYYSGVNEFQTALDAAAEALAAARRCGDREEEIESLVLRAWVAERSGQLHLAREAAQAALRAADAAGNQRGRAASLNHLGTVCYDLGDFASARVHYERALSVMTSLGDQRGEAIALTNLGNVHYSDGSYATARQYHERSLAIRRGIGDRWGEAATLSNLSIIQYSLADYEAALDSGERALAIRTAIGDEQGQAISMINIGLVYHALGDYQTARTHLEQAVTIRRAMGDPRGVAKSLCNLAHTLCEEGELSSAKAYQEEALAMFRALGARADEAYSLSYLGRVLEGLGDLEGAVELYAGALTLRRSIGQFALAIGDLADLARTDLKRGELPAARARVGEVLAWIEQHGLNGLDEPLRALLTCIQVLEACGEDVLEQVVLRRASAEVTELAGKIRDPDLRNSFLDRVRVNMEILRRWGNESDLTQ